MRLLLTFIRVWLPIVVVGIGVLLWAVDPSVSRAEGSAHIVGAGVAIWILNLLLRIGITGDADRRKEDDARAFFDRHGHWPDESPPPTPATRGRRAA